MVLGRPSGPVSLYGVPLPMKNCNLPFLFHLIKSKYMKSLIGNEKTRSLYKSSHSNYTRNSANLSLSVFSSVVQAPSNFLSLK